MNYWLIKSEPFKYSWDKFVQDGQTMWDGVRNYAARNNLRSMKVGDRAFFYHSNEGLEIVGIAEVVREAYQDPTTDDTNWVVVDFRPLTKLPQPVSLAVVKSTESLAQMQLIKLSRLSVSAVTAEEYDIICKMGKI